MVDFTNGPAPAGFFSPQRFEAEIFDCEVEGSVPKDLDGKWKFKVRKVYTEGRDDKKLWYPELGEIDPRTRKPPQ